MVNLDFAFTWINKTIRLAMMKQLATKETNTYNFKKVHVHFNKESTSYKLRLRGTRELSENKGSVL